MSDELPNWIRVDADEGADLPEVLYLLEDEDEFKKMCGNDIPKKANDDGEHEYNYCFAKYDGSRDNNDISRVYYKFSDRSYSRYTKASFISLNDKFFLELSLLWKGAIDEKMVVEGYAPLHVAVSRGNINFVRVLLDAKANPNIRTSEKRTPLYDAVDRNNTDIIKVLLDAKANPNIPGSYTTPINIATIKGHVDTVKTLLEAKANPTLRMHQDSLTPLEYARRLYPENTELLALLTP